MGATATRDGGYSVHATCSQGPGIAHLQAEWCIDMGYGMQSLCTGP